MTGLETCDRLPRRNMAAHPAEHWRPPLFAASGGRRQRFVAALRRYFDLQAGSIWNDLALLLPPRRGTLLDVGCGAQPYRPLLSAEVVYIGLDTADAKGHFGYETPDTRYYAGDRWPVADEEADTVLCTETLEHVREPRPFLAEAYRCLQPGGSLLLTVPFAARWHFIPYDYWRYTPSGLQYLLEETGFTEVQVYARGNPVTVACYKGMALILPLLFPQTPSAAVSWLLRLAGLVFLPAFLLLAVGGNLSLRGEGGDDCLGYTVLATKPSTPPQQRPSLQTVNEPETSCK